MSDLRWFVIQLHPYTVKKKRFDEIAAEVRRRLRDPTIQLFYGVHEDEVGKYPSPWEEYIFVEYRDTLKIGELKDEEYFISVLRSPRGELALVDDFELETAREFLKKTPRLRIGEKIRVTEGSHDGYDGVVLSYCPGEIEGEAQIVVELVTGEGVEEAAIPCRWVKRKKKKK